jgi:hypothetical protein
MAKVIYARGRRTLVLIIITLFIGTVNFDVRTKFDIYVSLLSLGRYLGYRPPSSPWFIRYVLLKFTVPK